MLKQRLIGAAVLVALAVIFIPMVLEEPDRTVPDMRAMPEEQALPHGGELRDLDVGEDQALTLPPIGVVSEREAADLAKVAPAAGAAAPSEQVAEEPPVEAAAPESGPPAVAEMPAAEPPAAPAASGPAGNWVIQVGSFGNQSNATALRDKLRADGYVTQVERVVLGSGETFRVRVGPYLDKAQAEDTAAKLDKSHGVTPRVMSYP